MTENATPNAPETPLGESLRRLKGWKRPKGETPFELAARMLITPPNRRK